VHIGAILTIAGSPPGSGNSHGRGDANSLVLGRSIALWELLGKSLLDRMIERLHVFGVDRVSVLFEDTLYRPTETRALAGSPASGGSAFWSAWDGVVSEYLNHGMETLILARIGPYAEIDLADLLRSHQQMGNSLTQVYRRDMPLDFVVVGGARLRAGEGSYRSRLSSLLHQRQIYQMEGCFNSLSGPADFRQLVIDALLGECSIRPVGLEVEPGIWLGKGALVDASCLLEAPVYIGANTSLGPACRVLGMTSIEKACDADAGTTVEQSCVLEGTYLGMGLHVRNALAGNGRLFHLERDIEIEIQDSRLVGKPSVHHHVTRAARSFMSSVLSTRVAQHASVNRQVVAADLKGKENNRDGA